MSRYRGHTALLASLRTTTTSSSLGLLKVSSSTQALTRRKGFGIRALGISSSGLCTICSSWCLGLSSQNPRIPPSFSWTEAREKTSPSRRSFFSSSSSSSSHSSRSRGGVSLRGVRGWGTTFVTSGEVELPIKTKSRERGAMVKRKLYAVKNGRRPGLYNTWKEAEEQVKGYSHAVHRSFTSRKEAEEYLGGSGGGTSKDDLQAKTERDDDEGKEEEVVTVVAEADAKQAKALWTVQVVDERSESPKVSEKERGKAKHKAEPNPDVIDLTGEDEHQDQDQDQEVDRALLTEMNLLAEDADRDRSDDGNERPKKSERKGTKTNSNQKADDKDENNSTRKKKKRRKVRLTSTRVGEYHLMQFDGGARGNPGVAGAGVVLLSPEGEVLHKKSLYLGDDRTNNQAEYEALILGLQMGLDLGHKKLEVEGDSLLVIHQVVGDWQVRSTALALLKERVVAVLDQMEDVVIRHIPRDENKIADQLANTAMDEHNKA